MILLARTWPGNFCRWDIPDREGTPIIRAERNISDPFPRVKRVLSGSHGRAQHERSIEDPEKAESARIFKAYWDLARSNPEYVEQKKLFLKKY